MHKYRSKKDAVRTLGRYLGMHDRKIVRFKSRYLIVGICEGDYHALGDHGWAYELPQADAADIISAYRNN